jgi:Leucine-rich repeat (LRR) protein
MFTIRYTDDLPRPNKNAYVHVFPLRFAGTDSHVEDIIADAELRVLIVAGPGDKFRLSPCWWNKTGLTNFSVTQSSLSEIPRAVANLRNLRSLFVGQNRISRLAGELGRLPELQQLDLSDNELVWIPSSLDRPFEFLDLSCNRLVPVRKPISGWLSIRDEMNGRNRTPGELVLERCNELRVFAFEFTEAAIGLQDLELPALVTLEILDALCPNAVLYKNPERVFVRMAAKWDLIVAVKYFRRVEK